MEIDKNLEIILPLNWSYQYNLMASANLTVILFLDFYQFPSQPFFLKFI
jgi:hypothetical protein